MPEFVANLGDGFIVSIWYSLDNEGDVDDLEVKSSTTGESLDDLIYGSSLWDQAAKKAEEHRDSQLLPTKTLRQRRLDVAAQCHDTPYAYAMGAV